MWSWPKICTLLLGNTIVFDQACIYYGHVYEAMRNEDYTCLVSQTQWIIPTEEWGNRFSSQIALIWKEPYIKRQCLNHNHDFLCSPLFLNYLIYELRYILSSKHLLTDFCISGTFSRQLWLNNSHTHTQSKFFSLVTAGHIHNNKSGHRYLQTL